PTPREAPALRGALIEAVDKRGRKLRPGNVDRFGERYIRDFEMTTNAGKATVRSAWIVLAGESVLRFTTCYVL
ncbi:MAG: DUF6883 domain-containing protein, partial [Stellaceae bacterium]